MSSKTNKIIYWVATGLFSLMMVGSASMYFLNYDEIVKSFEGWSFPGYIVYPLAIAKILGVIAIVTRKSNTLKEWAYAGFFFNTLLAASAHLNVNDGEHYGAIMAMVLVLVSYIFEKRTFGGSF